MIYKILSAIAAVALGAAVMLALPGFSPEVEARTPAPVFKSDRLDVHPTGTACSERAWPYFEASCLRNPAHPNAQVRTVRLVTSDRFGR